MIADAHAAEGASDGTGADASRDRPEQESALSEQTGSGAAGGELAEGAETPRAASWRVLAHPSILALFVCHMVYNLVTLSINSWMPTYYAEVLHLAPDAAKLHLTVPHLAALCLKLVVSRFATALRATTGSSMLASRRLMCALGYTTTAVPLMLLPYVSNPKAHPTWRTTTLFSLALIGTGFHAEGFRANYLDVTRAHVGLVSGVGNCLSSVAAMGAPLIVGAMVQAADGQWAPVWRAASGACVVATAIFCSLSTSTPVEEGILANRRDKAA